MISITNIEELKANLLIDSNFVLDVKNFYELKNVVDFASEDKLNYLKSMLQNIQYEIFNVKMRIGGEHSSNIQDSILIHFPHGLDLINLRSSVYTVKYNTLLHRLQLI